MTPATNTFKLQTQPFSTAQLQPSYNTVLMFRVAEILLEMLATLDRVNDNSK